MYAWQPQQEDVIKALPKPLPALVVASYMADNKEEEDGDKQEEVGFYGYIHMLIIQMLLKGKLYLHGKQPFFQLT